MAEPSQDELKRRILQQLYPGNTDQIGSLSPQDLNAIWQQVMDIPYQTETGEPNPAYQAADRAERLASSLGYSIEGYNIVKAKGAKEAGSIQERLIESLIEGGVLSDQEGNEILFNWAFRDLKSGAKEPRVPSLQETMFAGLSPEEQAQATRTQFGLAASAGDILSEQGQTQRNIRTQATQMWQGLLPRMAPQGVQYAPGGEPGGLYQRQLGWDPEASRVIPFDRANQLYRQLLGAAGGGP